MLRRSLFTTLIAAAISLGPALQASTAKDIVIFAAASLKNALDEAAAAWAKETGKPAPRISYAASNTLAKQIEQGAPADIFISADLGWMDYVAARNLTRPETRVSLLANRMLAATVVVEAVFAIPGMGSLIVNGALHRDFPVVQGVVFTMVLIVVTLNLVTDVLYSVLDPRIA